MNQLFKLGLLTDTIQIYILILYVSDLNLDSRSERCENINTSIQIILQSCQMIWIEFVMLLRLVGLMMLILSLCVIINIQRR